MAPPLSAAGPPLPSAGRVLDSFWRNTFQRMAQYHARYADVTPMLDHSASPIVKTAANAPRPRETGQIRQRVTPRSRLGHVITARDRSANP
jgi:hypothetical protein